MQLPRFQCFEGNEVRSAHSAALDRIVAHGSTQGIALEPVPRFGGRARGLVIAAAIAVAAAGCAKDQAQNGLGAAAGAGYGVGAPGSVQDFASNVGDRVFFDTDQTELSATAQATLDKQARWLTQYSRYNFTIEGHADERGTREYNFALGARRAQAAKEYLVARGIAASRIKTISYGKERPVAVCNDISCWSQNRRAVTVLKGGES